jgi:hypothetical protein
VTEALVDERPGEDAVTNQEALAELSEDICDRLHDPQRVRDRLSGIVNRVVQVQRRLPEIVCRHCNGRPEHDRSVEHVAAHHSADVSRRPIDIDDLEGDAQPGDRVSRFRSTDVAARARRTASPPHA